MPVSVRLHQDFTIARIEGAGTADMRLEADITYDAQYSTVLSVDSADVYQFGYFVNFDSWLLTDILPFISSIMPFTMLSPSPVPSV